MTVRAAVARLALLGPLPDSAASEETIASHQVLLEAIERPVSKEEARVLLTLFGPDDCYGLAWTLLHLIETAGPAQFPEPNDSENPWLRQIWLRSNRE